MAKRIIFTPENLIANIDKLGVWSSYGLAVEALTHYFPELEFIEDPVERIEAEVKCVEKLGCEFWTDVIIKYHKDVGYTGQFNPDAVNEF